MKYCIKCGNKLEEDQLFCGNCGAKKGSVMSTNYQDRTEEYRTQPTTMTTQPQQAYTYQNIQQVGSTPHSEHVNRKEYQNFKTSCIIFALIPIIDFISNIVIFDTNLAIIISVIINFVGMTIFVLGIYSFKNLGKINSINQMERSIFLLMLFAILNSISNLSLLALPELSTSASLFQVQEYVQLALILIAFVFLITFILLIGVIDFNKWFNEFSLINRVQITSRVKWLGILTLVGNGFLLLSIIILHQAAFSVGTSSNYSVLEMIENSDLFLGIGSIVLLASYIMQVLAGYKIYNILSELENRVNYQKFNSRQNYQEF